LKRKAHLKIWLIEKRKRERRKKKEKKPDHAGKPSIWILQCELQVIQLGKK